MDGSRQVGFVGFGAMSRPMAGRLRDAGYEVSAFDPALAGESVDGFALLGSARAVAEAVDAVLVCVPNDQVLDAASSGEQGVLAGSRPGQLVINFSTVSPEASRALAERVAGRGGRFVEAPMSGSTPQAADGTLVILAAGEPADVRAAAPILDVVGRRTFALGAAGEGLVAKLIVNGVMALGTAALAEGLAYGERAGLDRGAMIDVLSDLILVSDHHKHKLAMAGADSYPPEFPARLMSKDMALLLADAGGRGITLPTMAAAAELFTRAARERPDEDYAAAIAVARSGDPGA